MWRTIIGLLMSLAIVAAACGDDDQGSTAAEQEPSSASASEPAPAEPVGEAGGSPAVAAGQSDESTAAGTEGSGADPGAGESGGDTEAAGAATEPAWEEVAGGADCMCADGSDWNFWVREADPEKVVLYFQGGGACFDAGSCSFTDGTYDVTVGAEDDPDGGGGIFDFSNPANPFADWSFVFVPYCTGDVHIGDNTQDYGDGLVVEHNGFANASHALDDLVARFPGATEVVSTGSSAGGVPAPLFAGLVADELPAARVVALADGSGAYADVPGVNAAIGALWGTFDNVPDWPVNADLTAVDWSIPGLFTQAGLHDPEIVLARHDHAFDGVQESFASASGTLSGDLASLIDANAAQIEAAGVPVFTYVAPGTEHTILGRDIFYTQVVDGTPFVDWVSALVTGEAVADVHCADCE